LDCGSSTHSARDGESAVDIEEHNSVLDRAVSEERDDTGGDSGHGVGVLDDLA
jgi:hypothetical protein